MTCEGQKVRVKRRIEQGKKERKDYAFRRQFNEGQENECLSQ